jgi:hypothetical protein
LRSFQAGSTLRKRPGVSASLYHPTPNPSPFVVVAPRRACRLWSMSEWSRLAEELSRRIGDQE